MAPSFGAAYVPPLLPEFLPRYPAIVPDWRFENRQVDLIAQGYDAAIGGIGSSPAWWRASWHLVHRRVAAPSHIGGSYRAPSAISRRQGIVRRSPQSGRVRSWVMRDQAGTEEAEALPPRVVLDDPEAMTQAAVMGLGAALVAMPQALPHLEGGALVRLVPDWHAVGGTIALYYASRTLLPAKTRAFVDFVVAAFQRQGLARRFSATP
jgi:DNA-binding transcriptional LysR family regulator